jgi:hypothetical protein
MILYRRKDLPGTLLRSKGVVTRERMQRDPAFTNTLRHAIEGGGRSQAAKAMRRVLHPLEAVRGATLPIWPPADRPPP